MTAAALRSGPQWSFVRHRLRLARSTARAISAAICPWLARNELASAAVTLITTVIGAAHHLRLADDPLRWHDQLAASCNDRHIVGQQTTAGETAAVETRCIGERSTFSVADRRRVLAHDTAFVELAEQAAARETALQQPSRRTRDRLPHRDPALGDISPRQVAAGDRQKVVTWLKQLENHAARNDPADPMANYDITWLWAELGVSDLRR